MTGPSTRTTGGDPLAGVDPGGTHSTKPGNPNKSGPARPERVAEDQAIKSGDRNTGEPDGPAGDPQS